MTTSAAAALGVRQKLSRTREAVPHRALVVVFPTDEQVMIAALVRGDGQVTTGGMHSLLRPSRLRGLATATAPLACVLVMCVFVTERHSFVVDAALSLSPPREPTEVPGTGGHPVPERDHAWLVHGEVEPFERRDRIGLSRRWPRGGEFRRATLDRAASADAWGAARRQVECEGMRATRRWPLSSAPPRPAPVAHDPREDRSPKARSLRRGSLRHRQ